MVTLGLNQSWNNLRRLTELSFGIQASIYSLGSLMMLQHSIIHSVRNISEATRLEFSTCSRNSSMVSGMTCFRLGMSMRRKPPYLGKEEIKAMNRKTVKTGTSASWPSRFWHTHTLLGSFNYLAYGHCRGVSRILNRGGSPVRAKPELASAERCEKNVDTKTLRRDFLVPESQNRTHRIGQDLMFKM
jgi:hypothetical protein